jgi:hypothetical protein
MAKEQGEIVYNLEYGISKGYLQKKVIYLKPVGNKNLTLTTKEKGNNQIHGFMYEDAIIDRCLPMNERMQYYDPFKNDDEKKFFEAMLGVDFSLNPNKENCIWNVGKDLTTRLRFEVNALVKTIGYKFDMMKPEDVIKYKVAKMQWDMVPSTEEIKPHHTWVLIDKEIEETSKMDAAKDFMEAYMAFGAIEQHVDKMREFLNLYILANKISETIPDNMTQNALIVRLKQIIDKDMKGFLEIVRDADKEFKLLLLKAIKAGAITKTGVNGFDFPGVGKWDYNQAIDMLKLYKTKREEDETYDTLIARIDLANGELPGKSKK